MGELFQNDKLYNPVKSVTDPYDTGGRLKDDSDLIIEENTVYEVDRECYERLKKQKKRKVQEKNEYIIKGLH